MQATIAGHAPKCCDPVRSIKGAVKRLADRAVITVTGGERPAS
jgi:hypothetical protein